MVPGRGTTNNIAIEHEPYELVPTGIPDDLPEAYVVRKDHDELVDAVAADLYVHAHNCVRTFGDFHLALTGGTTPQPLYRRLMYDPRFRDLPWKRTHLWLTNQTASGEAVGELLNEIIGLHAGVPASQVHLSMGDAPSYAAELREHLGWREKGHDRLDYVLLGVDTRGGVAGLEGTDLATPEPVTHGPGGVSLSLGMINASRFIAVFAMGARKRVPLEDRGTIVSRVAPLSGELRYYLDPDALPGSDARQRRGSNGADHA